MDFNYIEELVNKYKSGDMISKEKLAQEFKPFIINISKKTFIDGYEMHDAQNECYKSLFKCVLLYNLERHRFVAYATNGIKNNTVRSYACLKNLCYSTTSLKKKVTLKKIFNYISLNYKSINA